MAEVIGLRTKEPMLLDPTEHAKEIQRILEDVARDNSAEKIRSIMVLVVQHDGCHYHDSVRLERDNYELIGAMEVWKHRLLNAVAAAFVSSEEQP